MLKNKILLFCLVLTTAFVACKKNEPYDSAKHLAIDDAKIVAYLTANNITNMQKDASGLYYRVLTEGTGTAPSLTDSVYVGYEGRLLGATTTFDKADIASPAKFLLGGVIPGWRIGLPKIQPGGKIQLIIPSPLGYQDFVIPGIPANSILDFTIDLVKVKK